MTSCRYIFIENYRERLGAPPATSIRITTASDCGVTFGGETHRTGSFDWKTAPYAEGDFVGGLTWDSIRVGVPHHIGTPRGLTYRAS
jgi:hypothetical protein